MSWKPEVDEIAQRSAWAEEMGGAEGIARQEARGRQTIRDRISALVDPGSFREVGKLAGTGEYVDGKPVGVTPSSYVMGLARIDGRDVALGGEDFTVRGGTGSTARRKGGQGGFVEDLAHEYRIPLINLIDGAGGSVTSLKRRGYAPMPGTDDFGRSVELLGEVPVITSVMGTAAGGPAARAMLAHFSTMVREKSQVFAAGPAVVERALGENLTADELGGAAIAVDTAGSIDNAYPSEADSLDAIRKFLSYMPQNVWSAPPFVETHDPADRRDDRLLSLVPRSRRQPYSMHKLMSIIADEGSTFEIQPTFGKSIITQFARFGGHVAGLIGNNPMHYGGALDAAGAQKMVHFIDLCNQFGIPIIYLADVPGFMIGSAAERSGVLRAGVRAVHAGLQASVPCMTVIIRKCYGMAGMAMVNQKGLNLKLAWPSGEWGSLPVEGGVAVAFRREIATAPDPAAREAELEAEFRTYANPFKTAEAFAVEDIIDPRDTRFHLCRQIEAAQERLRTDRGPRPQTGVRP
ncbi:propionyl-CoA carboxylase [Lutimaribacter sp. EGI FJ00015]|uniref:Propionyl-CoA carboxylase n=1 Tax=Lutimaribacter degradans TaxID=2945989 RepID=A0ACC5ZTM0_9RHOB|nr:carboxyl transferase domain-containing protein [Lutimaribacter sp. EGI FJ00013]MCM2561656.1 propionyl-CoA carboxylase [Lutimaribacter sp. EGI FJ00013]MCO0612632.1 propionyl-CoA carboxylase [Lutimaribacter sp. EGI FJ00015]MCO0635290.1 propionyl-CoA carboxylase [Lutimaribacter sp. EGI FJ00014]